MSRAHLYPWPNLTHPGMFFVWTQAADEMNLRSAASKYAKRKGIVITCKLVPKGVRVTYERNRL